MRTDEPADSAHLPGERAKVPPMSTVIAGEGTFESAGLQIFFRSWRPSLAPRAAVLIVPGFNSHSAYYAWTAQELVADRLAVYALDLRGRGKSDGERFYVETFDDYVSGSPLPVRTQRRRRRRLSVRPRSPSGARGPGLRELCAPAAGPGLCARRLQRAEPSRATRAHSAPQERRLLARSAGRCSDER